jgi:hypothetical protein
MVLTKSGRLLREGDAAAVAEGNGGGGDEEMVDDGASAV